MSGSIHTLHTFATSSLCRGIAFKGADIWMASPSPFIEQMRKADGVILANHGTGAGGGNLSLLYDQPRDQFWSAASSGSNVTRLDGAGGLVSNPPCGHSPYGQCVANGHYWVGNQSSGDLTELDAATGAVLVASLPIPAGNPTQSIGVIAFDGVSLWVPSLHALTQVDEASATVVNTFTPAGITRFGGLCFALGFLWATDFTTLQLYQLDLFGNVLNTYSLFALGNPGPICFDGTNFWTLDFGGGLTVTSPAGEFQDVTSVAGSAQWVANDGTPNVVWATSGGAPFQVQQFQFVPDAPLAGIVEGTFTGFWNAGHSGGGSK